MEPFSPTLPQRRMLLVDFTWTRDKDPRVPLGHASLLAALSAHGDLDLRSLVVPVNSARSRADLVVSRILRETADCAPDAVDVAFGAYVWGEDLLRSVLRGLRSGGFRGRIILGGPQVSYTGAQLQDLYLEADAFVRGYGERALCELASSPVPRPIAGVHWQGTPDLVVQAAVDLESLPSPWLSGLIPISRGAFVRWETQRGCPFRCAFCQHREAGARLRRRSLASSRVQAEVDLFCSAEVGEIAVLDPIFNAGAHAVDVLRQFADRGFRGRLSLQCRAETVTEEFLAAAAELDVCLEFGLQTIHLDEGRAVSRGNHIERVDATLAAVRSRGIAHEVSLIFGLPLQTRASFEASVSWCLARGVPVIKAFPLMLLRGTELERQREQWGLVDTGGAMPMVVASSTFTQQDWQAMARLSEGLCVTEGRHPGSLSELRRLSSGLVPNAFRWLPAGLEEAA